MKATICFKLMIIFILLSSFSPHLNAQKNQVELDSASVKEQLLKLNTDFWIAYNECDIEKLLSMESEDIEFYHDEGGLLVGASKSRKAWENFCSDKIWNTKARVADGIEIYELKDSGNLYGALIIGKLSFVQVRNSDGKEEPDGNSKYTFVLLYRNNEWTISRILSYNHEEVNSGIKSEE